MLGAEFWINSWEPFRRWPIDPGTASDSPVVDTAPAVGSPPTTGGQDTAGGATRCRSAMSGPGSAGTAAPPGSDGR